MQREDWVLPHLYPQVFIGSDKVWQSLVLDTPAIVAGHANLVVTQANNIDENPCPDA